MAASTRVEPDCTGRCRCRQTVRQVAHRGNHPRGDVPRVRTRKTDPRQPLDSAQALQQRREITGGIVRGLVVVHDLSKQLHFPCTGRDGVPRVRQDVRHRPHAFVPARVRHDAEGAELVAAFDDRDVRLDRIAPPRNPQRKRHIVDRIQRHGRAVLVSRLPLNGFSDQHRQPFQILRTNDDVDGFRPSQNLRPFLLRDATCNGDDGAAALLLGHQPDLAEPRKQFFLGALAHAARVDHDHVRVALVGCRFVA